MLARRMTEAQPLARLRDEMDMIFDRFFGEDQPLRTLDPFGGRRVAAVNIWQDEDCFFVELELPGLLEKDLELTVIGNELTIKGTRPEPELREGVTVHRRERFSGPFTRVVHLPLEVDEDKVEASFLNGVLTITLPKAEIAKARRIPVKALTG
jgi:HSP20 family protein